VIDRLRALRIFNLVLSGGEVFVRDDIFAILEHIRKAGGLAVCLITNGTRIGKKMATDLAALNIRRVLVSIDGLRAGHDYVRGSGSFDATLAGVDRLLAAGISPSISYTPLRSTFREFPPLADLLASMGIKQIRINTLVPEGRCIPAFLDLALEYPHDITELLAAIEDKRREYPALHLHTDLGYYFNLTASGESSGGERSASAPPPKFLKSGCGACTQSCQITAVGEVVPCPGLGRLSGGNIRDRDFLEIWRDSPNFNTIRALHEIPVSRIPQCRDCSYNSVCDAGCRASAFNVYHDLLGPDPLCPHWRMRDPSGSCAARSESTGAATPSKNLVRFPQDMQGVHLT
jgi:radical SAM protein with 4Fe4S-binding SPASM domain